MKVLIIKLGAIGDVLRTTSILKGLSENYEHIDWVTKKGSEDMLKGNEFIDNIFLVEDTYENLLGVEYDLVISLDDEDNACKIATNVKKKKIIGAYFDGDKKKYTDDSAPWFDMGLLSRFGKKRADELKKENTKTYQDIIGGIIGIKPHELILNLSLEEKKFGEDFANKNRINKEGLVIGLNTGAGGRWQLKKISIESTAKLAQKLVKELGSKVLLFGGPQEEERNKKIQDWVTDLKENIINAGCHNTLRQFASLVNLCKVLVTSDSLAMHIGIALKKKVIVFFGPTSEAEIELYGRGNKIVSQMDCLCCYKKECDFNPNCMDNIKVDDLVNRINFVI